MPKPTGRPTLYSEKLADDICELVADNYRLTEIEKMRGMPTRRSIVNWLGKYPEFDVKYTRAREELALAMSDEILAIADDTSNDWMERRGEKVPNMEVVMRSRVRIDTRRWLMTKILPKKFGDRLELDHSGELKITRVTFAESDG